MSNNLRIYRDEKGNELYITAFVGKNWDSSIQFTTKNDYVCLNRKQLLDLKKVIDNRLKQKSGYSATDTFTGKVER